MSLGHLLSLQSSFGAEDGEVAGLPSWWAAGMSWQEWQALSHLHCSTFLDFYFGLFNDIKSHADLIKLFPIGIFVKFSLDVLLKSIELIQFFGL